MTQRQAMTTQLSTFYYLAVKVWKRRLKNRRSFLIIWQSSLFFMTIRKKGESPNLYNHVINKVPPRSFITVLHKCCTIIFVNRSTWLRRNIAFKYWIFKSTVMPTSEKSVEWASSKAEFCTERRNYKVLGVCAQFMVYCWVSILRLPGKFIFITNPLSIPSLKFCCYLILVFSVGYFTVFKTNMLFHTGTSGQCNTGWRQTYLERAVEQDMKNLTKVRNLHCRCFFLQTLLFGLNIEIIRSTLEKELFN